MQIQKQKSRLNGVSVEKESIYYVGSLMPKCMLILMLLFFYCTYFTTYVYPLIAGEILQQSELKPLPLNSFHKTLLQVASFNDSMIQKIQLHTHFTQDQEYALVLTLVIHLLAALLIISLFRVSSTHPGTVTGEWVAEVQQYIDQKIYQEKIFKDNIKLQQQQQQQQQQEPVNMSNQQDEVKLKEDFHRDIQIFSDGNDSDDEEEFKRNIHLNYSSSNTEPIVFYQAESLQIGNATCPAQLQNQKFAYSVDQEEIEENTCLLNQLNNKFNGNTQCDQPNQDRCQRENSLSRVSDGGHATHDLESATQFQQANQRNNYKKSIDAQVQKADSLYDQDERQQLEEIRMFNIVIEDLERKGVRFCKTCQNFKPPRTHHCSQCRKCISKLDHHCQWLNACIGEKNYKFFLLIILYSIIILSIMCVTYTNRYIQQVQNPSATLFMDFTVSFFFYLSLIMEVLLVGFGFYHFQITSKNITTIEYCEKKKDNGKYGKGFKNNFQQAFGDNLISWFLPTTPIYKQSNEQYQFLESVKH